MTRDPVLTGIEFCLLGPLIVRRGEVVLPVGVGQQRAVLAALLLNRGRVVGLDELVETLWGPDPPPSARAGLQNNVHRLRKALGDAGSRICTRPGGYLIKAGAGELDTSRFEMLLGAARAAAQTGSWVAAAAEAVAALELWRGEPLADTGSELLALREVPRLGEMRLAALETRIEADLQLGGHAAVIGELRQLACLYPLRERLHGQLMLALYRDGRQAEALAAYQLARDALVAELGTEPGPSLRELQRQILTADPALAAAHGRPTVTIRRESVVPRQLPGTVRHFTGRAEELATLSGLLDQARGLVVIAAIGGTAGVGKTALALHWANEVADRFPDGQLYVNLRGYDAGRPVPPADALAGFLRGLGVPGQEIPAEADERAAQFRDLLAGGRMLVVLDNASSAAQVRPLLPGTPSCAVVVTSRDSLAGLVARDGAARLDLDLLPQEDAAGLLRALIGPRAVADPVAAATLADQCSRLPLALRVAAELAAAQPAAPLADLVAELADQRRRLNLLDAGGDPHTAVRAVFSWSGRYLDAAAAYAFRLAGLHPGPHLDVYSVAALTGSTAQEARRLLEVLARAHLVQPAGPGRYGMHDLLRSYACELSEIRDGPDEHRAALTRLFDYYLGTAAAAMDTLYPAEQHRRPRVAPPATSAPPMTDPAQARAWLDTQRDTLVAVVGHAADHGWPHHATRLAITVDRYLLTGGHYPESIAIHTCARRTARGVGDRAAEAESLTSLGAVALRQGRYPQAVGQLRRALMLFRQGDDRAGEAGVLRNLGVADFRQGRYPQAVAHFRKALALFRETGDRAGEASVLGNLGGIYLRQGDYPQAAAHLTQALMLYRETGDQRGEALTLGNLGLVDLEQGLFPQAAGHHRQALTLCREIGYSEGEASAMSGLGDVELGQGRYQQAAGHYRQALILFRETGNRSGEACVLNCLGNALADDGWPDQARPHHGAALDLAIQIGDTYEQGRAHYGLGRARLAAGQPAAATRHWQQALARYTSLGAPEADQVREALQSAASLRE